jgi:GRAS domain family
MTTIVSGGKTPQTEADMSPSVADEERTPAPPGEVNAWEHYDAVYDTIDQLYISEAEKKGLKTFFGRVVRDVVGTQHRDRFGRHEPARAWIACGRTVGWEVDESARPAVKPQPCITLSAGAYGLMMKRNKTGVIAVILPVKNAN